MDLLLALDTRTLAFISGLAGFLMALTMLGIHMAGTRDRALVDWGVAGLCFGFGFQLGHLLLSVEVAWPTWLPAAVANALVGSGHCMLLAGVRRYLGKPPWTPWLLLGVLVLFLTSIFFEPLRDHLAARVLAHSALYLAISVAIGVLMWRARAPGLTAYRRIVAGVAFANSAFIAGRMVYALLAPQLVTSFVRDPFQIMVFLISMGYIFALTLSLALMLFRGKAVQLQWLVQHDPLTGLRNRRSLGEYAQRELAHCARYGTPLSVAILDIDQFKAINDQGGHDVGDEVIRRVADRITGSLRTTDTAFRLGGEEFLVVLPATDEAAARQVAERLRATVAAAPVPRLGCPVTVSVGVTEIQARLEGWEEAVRRADAALYRAKREGRNRVVVLPRPPETTAAGSAGPPPTPATGGT